MSAPPSRKELIQYITDLGVRFYRSTDLLVSIVWILTLRRVWVSPHGSRLNIPIGKIEAETCNLR